MASGYRRRVRPAPGVGLRRGGPQTVTSAKSRTPRELVGRLKSGHGLGHGHASALVAHTLAEDGGT
ncbi:DUF4287 domain-containing protein [Streptomyces sp. NPDC005322]|uniref:DUF4287 domain-containing protein n=1 Tax=unclassified Streptomyces TaxID=2593676 RepID=UPI0033B6AB6F